MRNNPPVKALAGPMSSCVRNTFIFSSPIKLAAGQRLSAAKKNHHQFDRVLNLLTGMFLAAAAATKSMDEFTEAPVTTAVYHHAPG